MDNEKLISVFLASEPGSRKNVLYDIAWYVAAMDVPNDEKATRIREIFKAAIQRRGFGRQRGEIKQPDQPKLYNAQQIQKRIIKGMTRGLREPYQGKTQIEDSPYTHMD